jgi:GTPase SAR1 family protein
MQLCFASSKPEEREQSKKSKEIDHMLAKHGKAFKQECKLLLLGPGESGKSTVFKQMKIIQKNGGYKEEELATYKFIVFGNCITQMKVIVSAAMKLGIELDSEENKARAARISKLPAAGDAWSKQVGEDIKELWADKGILAAYEQRDKVYQLNDSASYFFSNIERFIEPNYLPSEQDVLRARVRTTGIEEAVFNFEDMGFRMLDVGGQRSERRKWIHCFDSVTAVVFCASLSEYDQTLREDDGQNRMRESLLLFDEICNSPWFKDTNFILFLNKTDLFREKIQKIDLSCCFPTYQGGCNFEAASAFIKARFLEQNASPHTIYTHFTCAISTENVEFVFKCVRETLLRNVMGELVL